MMASWKNQEINATIREIDEEGVDSENRPMRWLARPEAIQALKDGMCRRDSSSPGEIS
jgi:hypothetical protein